MWDQARQGLEGLETSEWACEGLEQVCNQARGWSGCETNLGAWGGCGTKPGRAWRDWKLVNGPGTGIAAQLVGIGASVGPRRRAGRVWVEG